MSLIKESFDNGKYTVIFSTVNAPNTTFKALRHGEEWRDLTGDGLVLAMLHEVERLRKVTAEVHSWIVCAAITTPEDMAQNFDRICEITAPDYQE
jgi:hypothetical protein